MVNVNKNIVPGKSAEKAEEKAPMRRPRNAELNSSAKTSRLTVRDRILRKLNSSKASWEEYFTRMTDEEVAEHFQIPVEEVREDNQNLEQHDYGTVVGHYVAKPEYEEALSEYAYLDILADGTVGYTLGEGGGHAIRFYSVDLNTIKETLDESTDFDSSCGDKADIDSSCDKVDADSSTELDSAEETEVVECLSDEQMAETIRHALEEVQAGADAEHAYPYTSDDTEGDSIPFFISNYDPQLHTVRVSSADNESWAFDGVSDSIEVLVRYAKMYAKWLNNHPEYFDDDLDSSKNLNCAEDSETKITTESGNEVSLSDIQIIQNPETNEISLFIKEDEDEEIPEGFIVIATASQPALPVEEPEVDEAAEGNEELDSSKKKNPGMN